MLEGVPAAANEGTVPQAADDDPSGVPEDEDEHSLTDSDAEGAHTFRHAAPEYQYCFARLHHKSRERKRTIEHLNARIVELERENQRLKDKIARLSQRGNTVRKTQVVRSFKKFEILKCLCSLTNRWSRPGQIALAERAGKESTGARAWREMLRLSSKSFIPI